MGMVATYPVRESLTGCPPFEHLVLVELPAKHVVPSQIKVNVVESHRSVGAVVDMGKGEVSVGRPCSLRRGFDRVHIRALDVG